MAALAASSTFAQSSVTISGLVDIGYGQVNAPANNAAVQTGDIKRVAQNGSATTAILIQGSEDLGGGMRALFRYELNPDFVGGSGLSGGAGAQGAGYNTQAGAAANSVALGNGANGYNFVGLQTANLGTVRFGRLNTGTLSAWVTGSVFGTAIGSGFGSSGIFARHVPPVGSNFNNTAPTRFNGALEWTSPTINDFTARVMYVPQVNVAGAGGLGGCIADATGITAAVGTPSGNCVTATAGEAALIPGANRAGATDFSVAYNKGPLNAVVAQQVVKIGSAGVNNLVSPIHNSNATSTFGQDYKLTTAATNYKIGNTTAYAAYWTEKQTSTSTPAIDASSYMLGVKYTMGAIDIAASMAKNNDKTANNRDRKIVGLGLDYNLSKRSALYARYESRDANTNNTADNATHGVTKTTHVGIRHTF